MCEPRASIIRAHAHRSVPDYYYGIRALIAALRDSVPSGEGGGRRRQRRLLS